MLVGNDIVDFREPQAQDKANQPRFLSKVCGSQEIELVQNAKDPHQMLWTLWSIKEATYKVALKDGYEHGFIATNFICKPIELFSKWECRYERKRIDVEVQITNEYVHAIAITGHEREQVVSAVAKVTSIGNESQEVRRLALSLLAEKGYPNCEILNYPPHVFLDGLPLAGCDISLSHDGHYLAVAILLPK